MLTTKFKPIALLTFFLFVFFVSVTAGNSALNSPDNAGNSSSSQEQKQKAAELGSPEESQDVARQADQTFDVTVTAPRIEIPLKANPAATTVVSTPLLRYLPRSIAIDEVMKLVPGLRVDNQADGERVHLSIRGQGILTERGTRGIKTFVDGIPLNDPTGFVSDFYDVDWATINRVEVLRGPAAAFYGSGSSGGILNIFTRDGGPKFFSGNGFLSGGSFGFFKGQAEVNGTTGSLNYRVSGSALSGDGYREHSKYDAKNFYGKFNFKPSTGSRWTIVLGWTDFFNENPEGLNLAWFSADPDTLRRKANPDSYAFNEYQKTKRLTTGISGSVTLASNLDLMMSAFLRHTGYEESVPSSVIHRGYNTPGISLQLNHSSGNGQVKNVLSIGTDLAWQSLDEFKHPNLGNAVEGPELLSDQAMSQTGAGVFLLDRIEFSPQWSGTMSLRYDRVSNRLDDHLKVDGLDLSGNVTYGKLTSRIGLAWNPLFNFGLYASWGTGFLPPGTEELVNNPYALGGYNTQLVAATSSGEEIGARGTVGHDFTYDIALFHLSTENDFGRYRIVTRPLETFYGNVGSTRRYGIETSLGWYPVDKLALRLAYTYSHFKYGTVQTLEAGTVYQGTWLPNSPQHQLYLDGEFKVTSRLTAGVSLEYVSSWYIDATNRIFPDGYGRTDPYSLVHVKLGYKFNVGGAPWELFLSGRNIFSVKYYGFTEPDPDGNSYQPAATASWTINLKIR
jgi:iron complex outermembrane receptor protein